MLSLAAAALSYVTIHTIRPDGVSTMREALECQTLAPGATLCAEVGTADASVVVEVHVFELPTECRDKVVKTSSLLLQYTGDARVLQQPPQPWTRFVAVEDFTSTDAIRLGVGQTVFGLDLALEDLCEGTKAVITIPPEVGFDEPDCRAPRPTAVPLNATLRYEVDIVKVLDVAPDGIPYIPCMFSLIDADRSGFLDESELQRHFARIRQTMPARAIIEEDTDGDGYVSFDEFTGPKTPQHVQEERRIQRLSQTK